MSIGAEHNVKVGDYLTVFRALGKGNLMMPNESLTIQNSSHGYESDEYRGGKFSNQGPRKSGESAAGGPVLQRKAKSGRPTGLRKVVGELVAINVKEKNCDGNCCPHRPGDPHRRLGGNSITRS